MDSSVGVDFILMGAHRDLIELTQHGFMSINKMDSQPLATTAAMLDCHHAPAAAKIFMVEPTSSKTIRSIMICLLTVYSMGFPRLR